MEYMGEMHRPAPNLTGVSLSRSEALTLFERLLHNVEVMLAHNRVHADLSAYNVLYWRHRGVIIDFPQAVMALTNGGAYSFLQRDLTRLCQHFSRYGVRADPEALAKDLWTRFLDAQL
jgi:RIO kinase 1